MKYVYLSKDDKYIQDIKHFLTFQLPTGKEYKLYFENLDKIAVPFVYYDYYLYKNNLKKEENKVLPIKNVYFDEIIKLVENRLNFKLKDYQVEIFKNFCERTPVKSFYTLPTGAGKSTVFLLLAILLVKNSYKVVYTVNNNKILKQFYNNYVSKFTDIFRVFFDKQEISNFNLAIVAPPSLFKVVAGNKNIVLLIDEAHISHKNYIEALDSGNVVGVCCTTATPPNVNIETQESYSAFKKLANFYYLSNYCDLSPKNNTDNLKELLVKKLNVDIVKVDFYNANLKFNEKKIPKLSNIKGKMLQSLYFESGSRALGLFNSFIDSNSISQDILIKLNEIVSKIDDKVIVFVKSLYKLFQIYNYFKNNTNYSIAIAYGNSNYSVIEKFIKTNDIKILVTSPISREGIDYKGIKYMISVDNYVSIISFLQTVGRILRINDKQEAYLYIFFPENILQKGSEITNYVPLEMITPINNMLMSRYKQIIKNIKNITKNFKIEVNLVNKNFDFYDNTKNMNYYIKKFMTDTLGYW